MEEIEEHFEDVRQRRLMENQQKIQAMRDQGMTERAIRKAL